MDKESTRMGQAVRVVRNLTFAELYGPGLDHGAEICVRAGLCGIVSWKADRCVEVDFDNGVLVHVDYDEVELIDEHAEATFEAIPLWSDLKNGPFMAMLDVFGKRVDGNIMLRMTPKQARHLTSRTVTTFLMTKEDEL